MNGSELADGSKGSNKHCCMIVVTHIIFDEKSILHVTGKSEKP